MPDPNEDLVKARILESEMALGSVQTLLDKDIADLKPGVRTQGEAFIANAPTLYGYERDTERIFMVLDLAASAINADPTYGGGYALAAACVYRLGVQDVDIYDSRSLTAAIPWAYRAITVDPDCQDGWEIYVQVHCYKSDFGTAEKALGQVLRRFGDGDLYARCALLYFRLKGDTHQAINWGALAWQTEWDTQRLIYTLFSLGHLYRDNQMWSKALDAYRVITERDHENAWAFHYASKCAAELGDYQYALELNGNALAFGQHHEFRNYRAELKKNAGRARLTRGRVSNAPTTTITPPPAKPATKLVAAPPAASNRVVAAPPAAKVVAAPPPSTRDKVVAAPPPAAPKFVPAPKPTQTKVVSAPPPAKK
jgi:tetratricopeptide (TPR) repeat protein